METPDVPTILRSLAERSGPARPVATRLNSTTFYLGRETLIASAGHAAHSLADGGVTRMARWRKKLFIFMARNAQSATAFFGISPNRVVELGAQIQF